MDIERCNELMSCRIWRTPVARRYARPPRGCAAPDEELVDLDGVAKRYSV